MTVRKTRVLAMAASMNAGGSERQTALLLRHLDRDRFDVSLALTHATGPLLDSLPGDVQIHAPPASALNPRRWDVPGAATARHAAWLADLVRKERIDVIYDRSFHMTLIAGDRRLAQRAASFHDRFAAGGGRPDRRAAVRLAQTSTAGCGVPTKCGGRGGFPSGGGLGGRYYRLDREIHVIANPHSPRGTPAPPAPDWASDPAWIHLVCVGRLSIEKGQRDLVDAIRRLPDFA